jgi:hypothetical protein
LQPIHQHLPLVRGKPLKHTRQFPEITGLHLYTYPIDSDSFETDPKSVILVNAHHDESAFSILAIFPG